MDESFQPILQEIFGSFPNPSHCQFAVIGAKEIVRTHIPIAKTMLGVSLQEFFAGGEELSIGNYAIVTRKIYAFREFVPIKGMFPNWIQVLDVC